MRRIVLGLLISMLMVCACFNGRSDAIPAWQNSHVGMQVEWSLMQAADTSALDQQSRDLLKKDASLLSSDVFNVLAAGFDPADFDADAWVREAKEAGLRYFIFTVKHHDGFCFWDSEYTDFDMGMTASKRDLLKEVADACHRHGIQLGWHYSILDWNHPKFPREKPDCADEMEPYLKYMMLQLKELLGNYGTVDILWFDGDWTKCWNEELGKKLYSWVNKLQPGIVVNNRVMGGRKLSTGLSRVGAPTADFQTAENEIPKSMDQGAAWEFRIPLFSKMSLKEPVSVWAKTSKLIMAMTQVTARGGNVLFKLSPDSKGRIPEPAQNRLKTVGKWLEYYGESIYGAQPGPFSSLRWGYCTQRRMGQLTRLYLHIWEFPEDHRLMLPGLYNEVESAFYLADPDWLVKVLRHDADLELYLPPEAYDPISSVVVVDVWGKPDVNKPPVFGNEFDIFIDKAAVKLFTDRRNVAIRYALDGANPTMNSPEYKKGIKIEESTLITARCFRNGLPVSPPVRRQFRRVEAKPAVKLRKMKYGLRYLYYPGQWKWPPKDGEATPQRKGLITPQKLQKLGAESSFAVTLDGYIKVPKTGVYEFTLITDYQGELAVDSIGVSLASGLSSEYKERRFRVGLEKGAHPIKMSFAQLSSKGMIYLVWRGPGIERELIPDKYLVNGVPIEETE